MNLMEEIENNRHALSESMKRLEEIVGTENLVEIIKEFGGCTIYIPLASRIETAALHKKIISDFKGKNYSDIAKKYKMSERQIRQIISDEDGLKRGKADEQSRKH